MNICIPVETNDGLNSVACAHFGSAPGFMIVDTDTGACKTIVNGNQHHGHGMCAPLQFLSGEQIDAMAVGGIGMGALNKLLAANIQVYLSDCETVGEVIEALKAGKLEVMQPGQACGRHGHGHQH